MAKTNPGKDAIQRILPENKLPEHLRGRKAMGVDTMREYVILPKLKVVQKTAGMELLNSSKVGDLLALPTRTPVRAVNPKKKCEHGQPLGDPLVFIPVFFFASWGQLNDIKKKGSEPTWLKYTVDKNDPLVALCKNSQTREQPHPRDPSCKVKNCEMLNFVVLLEDAGELSATPIILTFMRGEYRSGSDFASRIRMSNADIFARRWVMRTKYRPSRGQGDWYGVQVYRFEDMLLEEEFAKAHGERSAWVTAEEIVKLEEIHVAVVKQFELQGIKAVEDPDDAEAAVAEAQAASPAGNSY